MKEGLAFYRCILCRTVVSPWDIRDIHKCPKCAGVKVSPTELTWREKIVQIVKHPRIWRWHELQQ